MISNYKNTIASHESKLYNSLLIIFSLLTILQCGSVYDSNFKGEIIINALWQIVLFTLSFHYLHNIAGKYIDSMCRFLFCYFLIVLFILIFYYLYSPFTVFYFLLLLIDPVMLIVYFMGCMSSHNSSFNKIIFFKIENIILFLAAISLVFWIFELNGLSPNVTTMIKWSGSHAIKGFYYIQFMSQNSIQFLGKSVIRNTGIFVEAPIYSYILNIALIIELYMKKNPSKYKVLLLFIVIFSTTSTTGIIFSLISIFYYLFITLNSFYKCLLLFLIPILFYLIRYLLLNKINATGSSYMSRSSEWHIDVIDWKQHLLIGNGLPTLGGGTHSSYGLIVGLSSGLMASLAYGGIIFALFYILPSIISLFMSKKLFGISVMTFILFMFTIVMNFYIYVIILSYLWVIVLLNNNHDGEAII